MYDFLSHNLVWVIEADSPPFINTQIKFEDWGLILGVIVPIQEENPDQILSALTVFWFESVAVSRTFWKAPNIHELFWRIFRPGDIRPGDTVTDSSICEIWIRRVSYLGFIICIIWAWRYPTVYAYEAYRRNSNSIQEKVQKTMMVEFFVQNLITLSVSSKFPGRRVVVVGFSGNQFRCLAGGNDGEQEKDEVSQC